MVERIEAAAPGDVVRFVIAGDSGAWWDPTADGIYSELVRQVGELDPAAAFLVNLGDFAGPGTPQRHEQYLRLVESLAIPNLCVIGNHDLDDAGGWETFSRIHGPVNFSFACGHTRFVAIHAEPGVVGSTEVTGSEGPREEDLVFLEETLAAATEPNRVVLMHMPPHLGGHYAPHADWGFEEREQEFLAILRRHGVKLVCCAHGLAFDRHVVDGITVVMSGGGGSGLCSHYRGVCTQGDGHPEDRGALFHAVELAVTQDGSISGRVLQAFDRAGEKLRRF
jgi:Calcineurin-like phosphoesterase